MTSSLKKQSSSQKQGEKVTSSITGKHEKHTKLARAAYGDWGRHELAILGAPCDDIKNLADHIIQALPLYRIAYVDRRHKSDNSPEPGDANNISRAFIEYTEDFPSTQMYLRKQPGTFQRKTWLNDCDLILLNGNHFKASKQIIVLDERKPLEKKLDRLTDVKLIVAKDVSAKLPGWLAQHIVGITAVPQVSFTDTDSIVQHIRNYIQQQIPSVYGLVLSGGQSKRMGQDKGNLHYHNKSQREHVFDILCSHCSNTFISCNAEQSKEIATTPKIEDTFLNLGPLGGILSAFQHNPDAAWLTVACDLPFLNGDMIACLLNGRNPSKMATAFWDAEGKFPEPLVTIWEPRAYPALLQFLAMGYSCPRKVLLNSDVEMLQAPDTTGFTNVNTKEEYEEVISLLHNSFYT